MQSISSALVAACLLVVGSQTSALMNCVMYNSFLIRLSGIGELYSARVKATW